MARRDFLGRQDGATAVYFALLAPILIGFAALGAEAGMWLIAQRKLQQIADVAAYSGAARQMSTADTALIRQAALDSAEASGHPTGDPITVSIPPQSGAFAGQAGYVQVSVQHAVPRFITGLFTGDTDPVQISATSVAGADVDSGEDVCMLALSPTASPAFSAGGAGTINVDNCGFSTNSVAANSFAMVGAKVEVSGSCLYTAGGVSVTDGLTLTDCDAPRTLQRPTADPYANLQPPTATDLAGIVPSALTTLTGNFVANQFLLTYPDLPVALFRGGLTMQSTVSLSRGLYVIDGGTLKINANAVVSGTGVSFLLLNGAKLDVAGGATLNVKAYDSANPQLRTDPFAGLLFFSDGVGTPVSHSLSGNSQSRTNGVIYFREDKLTYTGDSGQAYPCLQIIASTLAVSGSGTLNIGCIPDLPPDAPPIRANQRISLVE